MPQQWFRMYREIISDPKLKRVTPGQRWLWVHLLCLALEHDGVIRIAQGVGYSKEELAQDVGLTLGQVAEAETWFETAKMLKIDKSRVMRILNWKRRQFSSDYSTERVRRFRARQAGQDMKRDNERERNVSETPPDQNRPEQTRPEQRKKRGFAAPTPEEVSEFASQQGYKFDAENFVSFYGSKDWMVGKNKMKDWRRAVTGWWIRDGRPLLPEAKPIGPGATVNAEAKQHSDDPDWPEYQRLALAGKIGPGFLEWKG